MYRFSKFLNITWIAFSVSTLAFVSADEEYPDMSDESYEMPPGDEDYDMEEVGGEDFEEEEDPVENKFFEACSEGNVETVKETLKDRPELLNQLDPFGMNCLHMAGTPYEESENEDEDGEGDMDSMFKEPIEMVKFLVEAGADVNVRSSDDYGRMTPLAFQVSSFFPETTEYLISKGADVNAGFDGFGPDGEQRQGWTVLDLYEDFAADMTEDVMEMYGKKFGEHMEKTKEVLLKNGAKRGVGTDEL